MSPRKLAAAAVAAAALTAPAAAVAHERPSMAGVKAHAAKAESALQRVEALVAGSQNAAAAVAYAKSRVQTRAATADARALTAEGGPRAARANRVLAALHDDNADVLARLVADASADQVDFAKALAASVKGRDIALAKLAELAPRLPDAAQKGIANAIAAVSADGEEEIATLAEMSSAVAIPDAAKPWLELALGYATEGMAHAVGQLERALGLVPEQARPHIQMALGKVNEAMQRVSRILGGLFGSADGTEGGSPVPKGLPIPSGLPIPRGGPFAR